MCCSFGSPELTSSDKNSRQELAQDPTSFSQCRISAQTDTALHLSDYQAKFGHLATNLPQTNPQFIIIGASGDLTKRKLLREISEILATKNDQGMELLGPETKFLLIGTTEKDAEHYSRSVLDFFDKHKETAADPQKVKKLLNLAEYHRYDPETGFQTLTKKLPNPGKNQKRIIYLATPSSAVIEIWTQLKSAGVITDDTIAILEKPYGEDTKSARDLFCALSEDLASGKIRLIDHYLGKAGTATLLSLSSIPGLTKYLNKENIEYVECNISEKIGIEGRISYDRYGGAIRDMLINHIFQLVTLLTISPDMDSIDTAKQFSKAKRKALISMRDIAPKDLVRAQYTNGKFTSGKETPGYLAEIGKENSDTETFVAAKLWFDNPRWENVPFLVKHIKAGEDRYAQIVINLRRNPKDIDPQRPKKIVIQIQPEPGVSIFYPGQESPQTFKLENPEIFKKLDGHSRLLLQLCHDDTSMFPHFVEALTAWSKIANLPKDLSTLGMYHYAPGTNGPSEQQRLLPAGKSWTTRI